MIKDYYEKLRLDFFNKIDAIKTQNYFEFYKHSPALLIALNLAYFVLAEEQIVSLDKNSKNITSRYKLNISPKIIDDLFDGKAFYQKLSGITKKEENGDNIWFLNALRNAILHGGIEDIDLEEMTINVSSTHSLNNLSANIPIEFFSSFIDKFSKSRFKNDNTLNIYLIEDKPYMFSQLVGKLQNGFNFQVKIKAEDPIEDAEFIKNQIQSLYDEVLTIYGEYLQEKMPEDENFKDMTQKLLQISDIRNSKNYTILVKEIIKEQLVKSIQKHFPVYNVSIEEIECEFLKKDKTLTKHGNMIYPETILDYLRYKGTLSFTDYLSQIEYLYQNYTENSKFVSKVMSFIGPQDTKKLTPGFIQKRIHAIRKEKGGSFTYDIRLAKILSIEHPPNSNDFSRIHNTDSQTAREISRKIYNYKKARNQDEMLIPILKKQYSDFFEKYNQIFRNKGDISDEDINIYNEISNADKMLEFYEMCVSDRSKILVGLLYVFGINMLQGMCCLLYNKMSFKK